MTRPSLASTFVIALGMLVTYGILPNDYPSNIFKLAAYCVALTLAVATAVEALSGARALLRVDLLMLWVLYGLTWLEFLFPQPTVDYLLSGDSASKAANAVLLGFAGLAVGRHLVPSFPTRLGASSSQTKMPSASVFMLFWSSALIGYLHIMLSVNFDVFEALRQMSWPRFSQSWSRGQLGGAYSLLYELGAFLYLLPPIAGIIFAQRDRFSIAQKTAVSTVLVITFYYAILSGTRSVLATYILTFIGSYLLFKPRVNVRQVLVLGAVLLLVFVGVSAYMLQFRSVGLEGFSFDDRQVETLFIDLNIVNIARLIEVFPQQYKFLGLEIPFNALIRPIPRVLWPGKPEGLSTSIESALGVEGLTLSCTFIGEAYMAAGFIGVIIAGLFFGAAAQGWNSITGTHSEFSKLLYASGFLCAAIAMRSMMSMVPLMLPTLALLLYGKVMLAQSTHSIPPSIQAGRDSSGSPEGRL